jgi:hypothetical protein
MHASMATKGQGIQAISVRYEPVEISTMVAALTTVDANGELALTDA